MSDPLDAIRAYIKTKIGDDPEIGIICGSGLGSLAEEVEDRVVLSYAEIPHFPSTTVEGHTGELVFGRIGAARVMLMRGRFHFYEGHPTSKVRRAHASPGARFARAPLTHGPRGAPIPRHGRRS